MILASIINFVPYFIASGLPFFLNETPQSSEQFGFFLLFFISGLIITFICGLIAYIALIIRFQNLNKIRIQANDDLCCIYAGSMLDIDYLKILLTDNGINSMMNDSNNIGVYRLYVKWIDLEKSELIVNDFRKNKE